MQELDSAELLASATRPEPRPANGRDLVKLECLDALFHESLRMFPPSPSGTSRQLSEDTNLGGLELPAGTRLIIPPWGIHRSCAHWGPDAKTWRPERWLEGGKIGAVKRTQAGGTRWLPFSEGGQNCIGQHLAQVRPRY